MKEFGLGGIPSAPIGSTNDLAYLEQDMHKIYTNPAKNCGGPPGSGGKLN